jgi:anthranilate synthase component 1
VKPAFNFMLALTATTIAPAMILMSAGKIPFSAAPEDDRHLPDMHLALYNDVVVFDQATKLIYIISWVHLDADAQAAAQAAASSSNGSSGSQDSEVLRAAYDEGKQRLRHLVQRLSSPPPSLPPAQVSNSCRCQTLWSYVLHAAC